MKEKASVFFMWFTARGICSVCFKTNRASEHRSAEIIWLTCGNTSEAALRKILTANFQEASRRVGNSHLAADRFSWIVTAMSAQQVIAEFKELSPTERAQVAKFVVENDDSWIPEEFKQGMDDIAAGRVVDLDTALNERYPGDK